MYKIYAVEENLNIYSTFINGDGSEISYKDYYKQVNYIIIIFFFIGLVTIKSSSLNTKAISITLVKMYKK